MHATKQYLTSIKCSTSPYTKQGFVNKPYLDRRAQETGVEGDGSGATAARDQQWAKEPATDSGESDRPGRPDGRKVNWRLARVGRGLEQGVNLEGKRFILIIIIIILKNTALDECSTRRFNKRRNIWNRDSGKAMQHRLT